MKQGKSITELAQEIERQQAAKQDFVVDTRHLEMGANTNDVRLHGVGKQLKVNGIAHGQIAAETGIPKKYYDAMPMDLRATNVNHWWHNNDKPKKRLIRTLDGTMRADLSDRYRMVDNFDIVEATLPMLFERNDLIVHSCELTERRMYIKVGFDSMQRELKAGDVVRSGVIISNSEVGLGAIEAFPFMDRLICTNGMIIPEFGQRRNHIGRSLGTDVETAREIYRDETLMLEDKALMAKIQDTVRACIDNALFARLSNSFAEKMDIKMDADPVTVVERAVKKFSFTVEEGKMVLDNLINNADLEGQRNTAFGLINAVTRTAENVESYDRASELEKLGGAMIHLAPNEWKKLGEAA